ncbi:MAG TPA: NAD(P)H-dependent glycerol-3-phosphate dehydrogenase [Opitutales bacterium]|nr:NAD(P)H-dependent glycerol-3-phosphate dehydrogenase [Opitutales bacterium]
MNFCIYPAGAWSTAIALHLARTGHSVTLVPYTLDEAMHMTSSRQSLFLPGYSLPESVQIGMELAPALLEADVCVVGAPSRFLRSVCRSVRTAAKNAARLRSVVLLTKGLEEGSLLPATDVAESEFGPGLDVSVLSGPSFATQVASGMPTAIVLAGRAGEAKLRLLQEAMSGPTLRIYTSSDATGVCIGGSVKNVYAIAAGCCDGLELGDNAKAALLTRSLAEMVRVGVALGGRTETFFGLSGFGDLILTCNGRESRNRSFGESLARGMPLSELLAAGKTVEGYVSCASFIEICHKKQVDAPILEQVNLLIQGRIRPADAIASLMTRDLKPER